MNGRTKANLAVAYLRRSTDRQEQSIGDQRRAVEAYAQQHDYHILERYVDDGVSGAGVNSRKAFLQMIRDARMPDCPFSYILVYDIKRFSRLDPDETGHYRHLLRVAGVEVVYVAENFTGDDSDDLLLPVKQWQARQELKDLSKVTIRGLLSKADGGWWLGGTPPYGYDLAYCNGQAQFLFVLRYMADASKQVLDERGEVLRVLARGDKPMVSKQDRARLVLSAPARVETVRKMFSWYLGGRGFKAVAAKLNEEGIPSPRDGNWSKRHGAAWSLGTVRSILMNPSYTGDAVWNRRSFAKFHRIENGAAVATPKVKTKVVQHNEQDDWIVTRDAHPAVIPREMYEQAKALRKTRAKRSEHCYRTGRGAKSTFLLSGLIVCDHCGHRWQGYTTWPGRKRKDGSKIATRYYACGGYVTKGNTVCKRNVVQQDALEGFVIGEVGRSVRHLLKGVKPTELRKLIQECVDAPSEDMRKELAQLRDREADIRRRINGLIDNLTAENRDFVDERLREFKKELREIEPRIEQLQASVGFEIDLDAATREMLVCLEDFGRVLEAGSIDERRRVIRAFVKEIRLDPSRSEGRAEVFVLPDVTATGMEPAASSLYMVAGARCTHVKKTGAHWQWRPSATDTSPAACLQLA